MLKKLYKKITTHYKYDFNNILFIYMISNENGVDKSLINEKYRFNLLNLSNNLSPSRTSVK